MKNYDHLRTASLIAFWIGVVLLCIGTPCLGMFIKGAMNLHHKDSGQGEIPFHLLFGSISVVIGFLLCIASLFTGMFSWIKRPWTVLCGFGFIVLVLVMNAAVFYTFVNGWSATKLWFLERIPI